MGLIFMYKPPSRTKSDGFGAMHIDSAGMIELNPALNFLHTKVCISLSYESIENGRAQGTAEH